MRADSRSFSFTWMKGSSQKSLKNSQHRRFENVEGEQQENDANAQSSSTVTGEPKQQDGKEAAEGSWNNRRGSSGSRLRKLSNSLVKLRGHRYQSMNDIEDENNWQKISEEPLALDDEDQDDDIQRMDTQMEPDVVAASRPQIQPVPFKSLDNVVAEEGDMEAQEEAPGGNGLSLSKRLNKTVQDVKASFGHFSQKFRKSTRRRYRMGPGTPGSMTSPTRKILGRTPTKLYSPFGIESPISIKTPKRLADRPSTPRLTRKSMISGLVYSPSNNFRRDLDDARRGMQDFQILSRDITRRSVRF